MRQSDNANCHQTKQPVEQNICEALMGDTASSEQLGALRAVDGSTTRIAIRWRPALAQPDTLEPNHLGTAQGAWLDWDWNVGDTRLPMCLENNRQGAFKVFGLRYRSFAPAKGFRPALPCQAPLTLTLRHRSLAIQHTARLHE